MTRAAIQATTGFRCKAEFVFFPSEDKRWSMWFLLGLTSALMNSTSDLFLKLANRPRAESPPRLVDAALSGCLMHAGMTLITLPVACLLDPLPDISLETLWPVLVSSGIGLASAPLYVSAMRDAPLSLTAPLMAITPVCLLATGPLIVGDDFRLAGVGGVLICAAGIYTSNLESDKPWHWPLLNLWHNKGQLKMVAATVLFSISSPIDRLGVERMGTSWYIASLTLMIALGLAPVAMVGLLRGSAKPNLRSLAVSSIAATASAGSQFMAVTLAPVAYVICLKRLSTVIGPLFGRWFLDEPIGGRRVLGSWIIFVGTVLIALTSLIE
ncbi:EamA family transporter [Candidatus Uhrbacteria bacterium]|nr:EamA family transporter [Candidatus Uhrbacteria bacterium]